MKNRDKSPLRRSTRSYVIFAAFVLALCHPAAPVFAVPVTGGTGPGGLGTTDGTSSLRMWLRGDTLSGPTISNWADSSGSGNNVTQGTPANEPDFFQTAAFNGMAAASFAASTGKRLTHTTFLGTEFGGQNASMFTVYKNDTFPSNDHLGITTTGNAGSEVDLFGTTAGSRANFNGDFRNTRLNGLVLGYPETGSHIKSVISSQAPNSWELFSDGASFHATTQAWGLNGTFQVGASNHGAGFFNGEVAEIAIFNSALNSAQRQIVENYQSARYDIALSNNDRYAGDTLANGDYDLDVFGIGRVDASNQATSTGAAGFGIEASGATLGNNEWVLAGHKTETNSLVDDGGLKRWDRVWFVDKTAQDANGLDATFAFDFSDGGLGAPDPELLPVLLYSATDPFSFSALTGPSSINGDTVTFFVPNALLNDGFFTLGLVLVPEPSSFALLGLGLCGLMRRRRASATAHVRSLRCC